MLTVNQGTATVTLGNLTQNFDGTPKSVSVTTNPSGLAVDVTYDGSGSAPVNAGTYAVTATVNDPNYAGTAGGMLTINKATATVTLDNLTQNYDGTPKSVSVSTDPSALA